MCIRDSPRVRTDRTRPHRRRRRPCGRDGQRHRGLRGRSLRVLRVLAHGTHHRPARRWGLEDHRITLASVVVRLHEGLTMMIFGLIFSIISTVLPVVLIVWACLLYTS